MEMNLWKTDQILDLKLIETALEFATEIHKGQKRKNGEPYIIHPITVADILYDIGGNEKFICSGLLHDSLEDGLDPVFISAEIKRLFGDDVHFFVKSVTKRKKDSLYNEDEIQELFFIEFKENLKKDSGILFLKIADILHNLSTIENLKEERKQKWLNQLHNGYIPIIYQLYNEMSLYYKKMCDRLVEKLANELDNYLLTLN